MFPQTSQYWMGSEEVRFLACILWKPLEVMEGFQTWVSLCTWVSQSSTAFHPWQTFPSTSLKYPPKLQQIYCFVDSVGCLWCGESCRIPGSHGTPWKCNMDHCHFSAQMGIQILWRSFLVPWSPNVWKYLEFSSLASICWSSHQPQDSPSCSSRTNQFQGYAMHVVELHWHFQLVWQLRKKIGKFHTFSLLLRCHH